MNYELCIVHCELWWTYCYIVTLTIRGVNTFRIWGEEQVDSYTVSCI